MATDSELLVYAILGVVGVLAATGGCIVLYMYTYLQSYDSDRKGEDTAAIERRLRQEGDTVDRRHRVMLEKHLEAQLKVLKEAEKEFSEEQHRIAAEFEGKVEEYVHAGFDRNLAVMLVKAPRNEEKAMHIAIRKLEQEVERREKEAKAKKKEEARLDRDEKKRKLQEGTERREPKFQFNEAVDYDWRSAEGESARMKELREQLESLRVAVEEEKQKGERQKLEAQRSPAPSVLHSVVSVPPHEPALHFSPALAASEPDRSPSLTFKSRPNANASFATNLTAATTATTATLQTLPEMSPGLVIANPAVRSFIEGERPPLSPPSRPASLGGSFKQATIL